MAAADKLLLDVERVRGDLSACSPITDSLIDSLTTRGDVRTQIDNLKRLQRSLNDTRATLTQAIAAQEAVLANLQRCAEQENESIADCQKRLEACKANQATAMTVKKEALVVVQNLPDMSSATLAAAPLPAALDLFS
jgi:chromosome segregation ATPase